MHSNITDQRGRISVWKKRSLCTLRGSELMKVLRTACGAEWWEVLQSLLRAENRSLLLLHYPHWRSSQPPRRSMVEGKGAAWGEKNVVWTSVWWPFEVYTCIGWRLSLQGDSRLLLQRTRTYLKKKTMRMFHLAKLRLSLHETLVPHPSILPPPAPCIYQCTFWLYCCLVAK